jgi:hypothetical protein
MAKNPPPGDEERKKAVELAADAIEESAACRDARPV